MAVIFVHAPYVVCGLQLIIFCFVGVHPSLHLVGFVSKVCLCVGALLGVSGSTVCCSLTIINLG